jgi:hypothetical protein
LNRKIIATALLMALPAIAAEKAEKDYAVTVYAGYRGGGSFTDADTGQSLVLESNGAVSLALDLPFDASRQYQIFVSHQRTNLSLDTPPSAGSNRLLGDTFAVRVEARGYATLVNSNSGVFCSGGCVVSISGDTVSQGEVMLGLSTRF